MTLQQLEYIVAVGRYGSFVEAAEKCFVTQPTLSMQVKKLEDELGIVLFDRSRQPVAITEAGRQFLEQAQIILREQQRLLEMVKGLKGETGGDLRLAVIPTLAPYLLPVFVREFTNKYPGVNLIVREMTTEQIVRALRNETLDVGLLATPLPESDLHELHLFHEPFVGYLSKGHSLWNKKTIKVDDLDPEQIWLLSEGHCMRNQVLNLCREQPHSGDQQFVYESGSVETLKRLVDTGEGMTILPWLATVGMSNKQLQQVRYFRTPEPVRQISLVTHRSQLKRKLVELLANCIRQTIPTTLKRSMKQDIVPIEA